MVDTWAPIAQNLMDPIFTKISGLVDWCKGLFITLSFFWFLKGRCHGNQLKPKNRRFSRTNLICRYAIQKRNGITPCILWLGRNLTIVAHLARWRPETDRKIAILISEE